LQNYENWQDWDFFIQSHHFLVKGGSVCKIEELWCGNAFFDEEGRLQEKEWCEENYTLENLETFHKGNTSMCCLGLMTDTSFAVSCAVDLEDSDDYIQNKAAIENLFKEKGLDCSKCLKETNIKTWFYYYDKEH
jgi:hypothetical protein